MQILKDEVREQILRIAEKLFSEHGYLATTTRSIASEVGISVSNLYLYYENKETLFNAVADPIFRSLTIELERFLDHKDTKEDMNTTISLGIGILLAKNKGNNLMLIEKSKGTKYEDFLEELIQRLKKHILVQLNEQVKDKELMAGVFARSLMEGIVTLVKEHTSQSHLEENLKVLTSFYTQGLKSFMK